MGDTPIAGCFIMESRKWMKIDDLGVPQFMEISN
jgi:hypothetical protein